MKKKNIKIGLFTGDLDTAYKIFRIEDVEIPSFRSLTKEGDFIIPSKIQYKGEEYRVGLPFGNVYLDFYVEVRSLILEDGILVDTTPNCGININSDKIESIEVGKLDGYFYPSIIYANKLESIIYKDNPRLGGFIIEGNYLPLCKKLVLPHGLTEIGYNNYNELAEIVIPSTVKVIKSSAFTYCPGIIDNIHFLGPPPRVYNNSFSRSKKRENIIRVKPEYYNLYISDSSIIDIFSPKLNDNSDLRFEVLEGGDFCNITYNLNEELKNIYTGKIIIPEELYQRSKSGGYKKFKVLGISDLAFAFCDGLQEVHIPKSILEENISDTAFVGNSNIKIEWY